MASIIDRSQHCPAHSNAVLDEVIPEIPTVLASVSNTNLPSLAEKSKSSRLHQGLFHRAQSILGASSVHWKCASFLHQPQT